MCTFKKEVMASKLSQTFSPTCNQIKLQVAPNSCLNKALAACLKSIIISWTQVKSNPTIIEKKVWQSASTLKMVSDAFVGMNLQKSKGETRGSKPNLKKYLPQVVRSNSTQSMCWATGVRYTTISSTWWGISRPAHPQSMINLYSLKGTLNQTATSFTSLCSCTWNLKKLRLTSYSPKWLNKIPRWLRGWNNQLKRSWRSKVMRVVLGSILPLTSTSGRWTRSKRCTCFPKRKSPRKSLSNRICWRSTWLAPGGSLNMTLRRMALRLS